MTQLPVNGDVVDIHEQDGTKSVEYQGFKASREKGSLYVTFEDGNDDAITILISSLGGAPSILAAIDSFPCFLYANQLDENANASYIEILDVDSAADLGHLMTAISDAIR